MLPRTLGRCRPVAREIALPPSLANPSLAPELHPWLLAPALYAVLVLYALCWCAVLIAPRRGRALLSVGLLLHLVVMVARGWAIGFFPLTGKMESFTTMALALALVAALSWRPDRRYLLPLLTLALAAMVVALRFPMELRLPPPLMRTIWYPLHVPLSFLSYALWAAAAGAGLAWLRERDPLWLRLLDKLVLQGFGLWSLSMVFGGIWGVVAWGAYFIWDPKLIWSVVLWFHYASFLHLRLTPSLRRYPWVRPLLAWVGLLWIFIAYVGTSFFFGGSSHAF